MKNKKTSPGFGRLVSFLLCVTGLSFALQSAPAAHADELILYFISSPTGMNWKSPKTVAQSVLVNTVATLLGSQHSIGHAQTQLHCGGSDGQPEFFLASGMSNIDDTDQDLVLKKKIGLSVLYYNFEGYFEKGSEVFADIGSKYGLKHTNHVTFEISPSTCRRLQQYVTEFESRGFWRNYGLPNRPRYGEGSGCSAYAASFPDVGGLMLPEFKSGWTRFRRVPTQYLGGDLNGGKKVSIFKIAAESGSHWAAPNEDHKEIFFWDPDMMYRWVKYTYQEVLAGRADLGYPTVTEFNERGYGLRIDMSALPTPTGPIWLQDDDAGMDRSSASELKAWKSASNDMEARMNAALGDEAAE